jgi:hypothetical protein
MASAEKSVVATKEVTARIIELIRTGDPSAASEIRKPTFDPTIASHGGTTPLHTALVKAPLDTCYSHFITTVSNNHLAGASVEMPRSFSCC